MSNKTKLLAQGGALLVVGVIAISLHSEQSVLANANCSTEKECSALIEDTKAELEDLEAESNKKEEELEDLELDIASLLARIEKTETEITSTVSQIKVTEGKIKESEEALVILNQEISSLKETVATRMRMSQRLSKTNTILNIVSESKSITDLIRSLRIITHFASRDSEQMDSLKALVSEQQTIMQTLKSEKENLTQAKLKLEEQQTQLSSDKKSLEQKREDLKKQIQAIESEKMDAAEAIKIAQEQKELLIKLAEEEKKRQEEELKKQEEANKNQNSSSSSDSSSSSGSTTPSTPTIPNSSTFIIPLKTGYVTCEFMCYTNHTGIDLGNKGNTSTPVIASASGIVVRSGWHAAYGNHVILSHNVNGRVMTTVYAHMHTYPYVSAGEYVSQGQQLGTMGNTGNSFGAHLHFEIYEGYYNYPYAENPRKYINFPSRW